MRDNYFEDLRAGALGIGSALTLYYGYAAVLVIGGDASLARSLTWLGLSAGLAAVGWALNTAPRRPTSPPAAS